MVLEIIIMHNYASYPCDIIKLYFMDQCLKTLKIIMHGSIIYVHIILILIFMLHNFLISWLYNIIESYH